MSPRPTREQLDATIAFLEKQRENKARQCAALTCLNENRGALMERLLPESADGLYPVGELSFREIIEEAVEHLLDSTLQLSLQDLQGIDANLQLLKAQLSPIVIPQLGKRSG